MTSSNEPQGVLAPVVLLHESAANASDLDLIYGVVEFVNWALGDARLVFGELGAFAQGTHLTDQYIVQVNNGGHAQYVHNALVWNNRAGTLDLTLRSVARTLGECGETEHLVIFEDFARLLAAHNEMVARQYEDPRTMPQYDALDALDKRFYARKDKERDAARAQLVRTSPSVRFLADDALVAERNKVIAGNAMYEQRGKERQAALEKDPMYFAPRRLCAMAGLEFQHITAGQRTGTPGVISWGVMTSDGVRRMLLSENFAELYDFNLTTRLARIDF